MDKIKWLIWSIEHKAWWGPNCCGYTISQYEAGRYTYGEAIRIVADANMYRLILKRPVAPNEAMVPDVSPFQPEDKNKPEEKSIS